MCYGGVTGDALSCSSLRTLDMGSGDKSHILELPVSFFIWFSSLSTGEVTDEGQKNVHLIEPRRLTYRCHSFNKAQLCAGCYNLRGSNDYLRISLIVNIELNDKYQRSLVKVVLQ